MDELTGWIGDLKIDASSFCKAPHIFLKLELDFNFGVDTIIVSWNLPTLSPALCLFLQN